jgi:hypothetical protein
MHPLALYVAIRQDQEALQRRLRLERAVPSPRHGRGGQGTPPAARHPGSRATALAARLTGVLTRVLGRLRPRTA